LIPEAAEEIVGELQALFARHNAGAALSTKADFKPTKDFKPHDIRCIRRRKQADLLVGEPRGWRLHCHLPSFAGFVIGEASAFAGNVERRWCSRARFSIPKVKYARARAF